MLEKLPNNIQDYIKNDGSPLLDGYIRFLDKQSSERIYEIVSKSAIWNDGIPFATTVFGDLLAWEDGYVMLYKMSEEDYTVMLSGSAFFFDNLNDPEYQSDFLQLDLYAEAKSKLGEVKENECYVIEPIPRLGGAREVKYMSVGDLHSYLYLFV